MSELSRAGMSAYGIAAELNRRRVSAVNGVPWDDNAVIFATNLMKILQPNWRNCPPFKPFLGISHHARISAPEAVPQPVVGRPQWH